MEIFQFCMALLSWGSSENRLKPKTLPTKVNQVKLVQIRETLCT